MSKRRSTVNNSTVFHGAVNAGALHTGTGDVNIQSLSLGTTPQKSADELLDALRRFRDEVTAERSVSLTDEVADQIVVEIDLAESQVANSSTTSEKLTDRLKSIKELLLAASGTATAVTATAAAVDKLVPLLDSAIQAAKQAIQ